MKDLVVAAKVPAKKDEKGKEITAGMEATVVVQTAETLKEAGQVFGETAVLSNMDSNWKVTLQGNIRSSLRSGLTPEQIQDKLGSAVLGVAQVGARVDPQAAFIAKFKTSTPEDQAKMLEKLKVAAAG